MPDATRLNKVETVATAVTGGAFALASIDTCNRDSLLVQAQAGAAAVGDWTLLVVPYQGDGITLQPDTMAIIGSPVVAPAFAAGKVTAWSRFDVRGFDKVAVKFRNTTGGPLTIDRLTASLGPLEG
jgi:hypothetical protein